MTHKELQGAASVAGLIITTEASIADAPKPNQINGGGMPRGMDRRMEFQKRDQASGRVTASPFPLEGLDAIGASAPRLLLDARYP